MLSLQSDYGRLSRWLRDDALPLWSRVGVDFRHGGFQEKIDHQGKIVSVPRRTRVVGRQIYCFSIAAIHGWHDDAASLVRHGLKYLRTHCMSPSGLMIASCTAEGVPVRQDFDLYDHAFVLFGLAAATRANIDAKASEAFALKLLCQVKAHVGRSDGGFDESGSGGLPLRANPHMHLLEACLEWSEAGSAAPEWLETADAIVNLCLEHFIDPSSGALREFFDSEWKPISGDDGRLVEPGHQFEWAWLLIRWADLRKDAAALHAAKRLMDIADQHGTCDIRDVVFDEIWDDLSPRTKSARLWPQTERLKAFCTAWEMASNETAKRVAEDGITKATKGLMRFFETEVRGLWYDRMLPDGTFVDEPAPASSLYHIVCSIDTLAKTIEYGQNRLKAQACA